MKTMKTVMKKLLCFAVAAVLTLSLNGSVMVGQSQNTSPDAAPHGLVLPDYVTDHIFLDWNATFDESMFDELFYFLYSDVVVEYYFGWDTEYGRAALAESAAELYYLLLHSDVVVEYYFGWDTEYGQAALAASAAELYYLLHSGVVIEYYFGWDTEYGRAALAELAAQLYLQAYGVVEYHCGWDTEYGRAALAELERELNSFCGIVIEYYFGWDTEYARVTLAESAAELYFLQNYLLHSNVVIEYHLGYSEEFLRCLAITNEYLSRASGFNSFDCSEYDSIDRYIDLCYMEVDFILPSNLPPPTLTLSASAWNPDNLAGNLFVTVSSTRTWNISSNAAWLTVSNITPLNRTGNGSFRISVTANTTVNARTGTITVTAPGASTRTVSVTQLGLPTLTLSTNAWNPAHQAANSTINVISNRTWTVGSNASWLTANTFNPANRTGNGSFRINATANTGTAARTGMITVTVPGLSTRTISVTQAAAPILTLSRTSWTPGSPAGNVTVNVTSNRTWTVTSNAAWLTANTFNPANRTGNGSFRINVTANTGTAARTGTITVTAPGAATRTISVTQEAPPATLTLSVSTWTPNLNAGNATVNVTSNRTWTVTSNATWLTATNFNPANRTGNGSFRINVTANTGTVVRTGTITVTAPGAPTRTIAVTQEAPPSLTLSVTTWTPNLNAGNATVNVTSNRTWTVTSNAAWLTATNFNPANRTGNGSFRINVTANTGTAVRTGTVTVTAPGAPTRTIAVTQEAPPSLTLSVATWTPASAASNATVNVTSNRAWSVTSNAAWLTANTFNPINQTGNGSFRINVTANTGTASRTGTITVTAPGATTRTLSVTQEGFIWHSDENRVGFWPGVITFGSAQVIGEVPSDFNLQTKVTESRTRWQTALGISIGSAAHVNATVQTFGGSLAEMQYESGDMRIWAGLADLGTMTLERNLNINNVNRRVYRFSGTARTFVTYGLSDGVTNNWTADMVRHITVHEHGHALGFLGHAPNSNDVMYYRLSWDDSQGTISANEARHLRQIYDMFR